MDEKGLVRAPHGVREGGDDGVTPPEPPDGLERGARGGAGELGEPEARLDEAEEEGAEGLRGAAERGAALPLGEV